MTVFLFYSTPSFNYFITHSLTPIFKYPEYFNFECRLKALAFPLLPLPHEPIYGKTEEVFIDNGSHADFNNAGEPLSGSLAFETWKFVEVHIFPSNERK